MGRQSLSASSPFRTRYVAGKRQADVRVATAFRLRALFGHELPRFDITADGTSPQPFGFEPFSDRKAPTTIWNETTKSPQPFGFEPFSDSGRYYSFILNILQECFGMGIFLFMNKR